MQTHSRGVGGHAEDLGGFGPCVTFQVAQPHDRLVGGGQRRQGGEEGVPVFGGGGGLVELLTSNESVVNGPLAALYGVMGVDGDAFVPVDLDPTQRSGIFTQIGFLAANATGYDPDPIHRGVFLAQRMVCLHIAAPPDGVPPLPPLDPDQTNRERVEAHTETSQPCQSCHSSLINPFGFAFESFDATGAWRDLDNGKPVDTATEVIVGLGATPVSGAVELAEVMATSELVHNCYVKHWTEYATGIKSTPESDPMIARLGAASLDEQQSIHDLLVALTQSPAFLSRSAEELP